MVYTQMLFALFYDKVVWGTTLDGVAWIGSGLILGCAVYVAVMQEGKGGGGGGGGSGVKQGETGQATRERREGDGEAESASAQ